MDKYSKMSALMDNDENMSDDRKEQAASTSSNSVEDLANKNEPKTKSFLMKRVHSVEFVPMKKARKEFDEDSKESNKEGTKAPVDESIAGESKSPTKSNETHGEETVAPVDDKAIAGESKSPTKKSSNDSTKDKEGTESSNGDNEKQVEGNFANEEQMTERAGNGA